MIGISKVNFILVRTPQECMEGWARCLAMNLLYWDPSGLLSVESAENVMHM